MDDASAATLPTISIARSRACIVAHSFAHVRDRTALTTVKQENAQITPVNTFAERLKQAREAAGFRSQAALAKAAGLSAGSIGNWETGIRQQPRDLLALARVLGVSPYWLSGEKEVADLIADRPMFSRKQSGDTEIAHAVSYGPMETVPLISWEELMNEDPKGAFEFRVVMPDESMSPRVRSGAMLYFKAGETPRPGDGVLVRDSTRAVHFREYRAGRPGLWEAHAVNPHYQPMESERDGLTVLGVLTAVGARWG